MWYEAWEAQEEFESAEALALYWRSEVRRADYVAAALLTGNGTLDENTIMFTKLALNLPPSKLKRLVEVLNADGLVALATLVSRDYIGRHEIPEIISFYFGNLSYLGLYDEVKKLITNYYCETNSPELAKQAVLFMVDRGFFAEAISFVSATAICLHFKEELITHVQREKNFSHLILGSATSLTSSVNIINLPQDRYRRMNFSHRLSELRIPHVISRATRVDQIPENLLGLLRMPIEDGMDGSLGNQVSQYRVWERIAFQELPFGIVIEDDGYVKYGRIHQIDFRKVFGQFDIAFINDRMADYLPNGYDGATLSCLRLEDAMTIKADRQADTRAFGSDGYVLSRKGARKMLEIANSEGFHSPGTDWYLISHSFNRSFLSRVSDRSVMREVLQSRANAIDSNNILNGVVITPHFVEHRPLGTWRNTRNMS